VKKPSIFSRDYERKMKARRRKIITIVLVSILALTLIFTKILANSLNFDNLRVKIQTWIDSDNKNIGDQNNSEEINNQKNEGNISDETNDLLDEKEKSENITLIKEFKISEDNILKVSYEKLNDKETFNEVIENKENIYTTFNETKDLILIIDKNQNMKIFNINGEETTITKTVYTAPNGESFYKEDILKSYSDYVWHESAKFISDSKIAYISNMPYFGYDLNKYIWIYDISNNNHKLLLSSVAKEIKFNNLADKGLEVTLDGNVKYINNNGEIIN